MNTVSEKEQLLFKEKVEAISELYSSKIIGQQDLFQSLLIGLLTNGHILLEGLPGLAKTRAANIMARSVSAEFKRIQFTPDLLPSDVVGNQVFNPKDATYFVRKGPIFANFVLADEINRSPAKVQSALLEAMQERQVTIGGETFDLDHPFFVIATQNPIEQEGTYNLPEAQIDRFLLKTIITYPTIEEEVTMLNMTEFETDIDLKSVCTIKEILSLQKIVSNVFVDVRVKAYIAALINKTRPQRNNDEMIKENVSFGSSPRGGIAFMKAAKVLALLNGRTYVTPEDIKAIAHDVLRHRIILTYEAQAEGKKTDDIITHILNTTQVP